MRSQAKGDTGWQDMMTLKVALRGVALVALVGCGADVSSNQSQSQSQSLVDTGAMEDSADRMAAQAALGPQMNGLKDLAASDPLVSHVAVEPDTHKVVVYRVGGESAALLQKLKAKATVGTQVEIRSAVMSDARSNAFADLIDADIATLHARGVEISSTGPAGDGGKFIIGVSSDVTAALTVLQARYPDYAGQFTVESVDFQPQAYRLHDRVPFHGGARYHPGSDIGAGCTTGFAGENANGHYLITAAHCNCHLDADVTTWDNTALGYFITTEDKDIDAAYIHATNGGSTAVSSWIFAGALSGNPNSGLHVTSSYHPTTGEYVCMSGAYSYLRCSGVIKGWAYSYFSNCYGEAKIRHPEWYADQASGYSLGGNGDSGGPVFIRYSTYGEASARGIISSAPVSGYNAPCPAGTNLPGRVCHKRMYFPDIMVIRARHGLRLTGF